MSDNVGRRPDGPGAYHYEDDSNLMDCLVHYNQEGTRLQALWVGNDRFLPGYPTDKWRFIDDMPGDFVPLAKPVAAPEPDWSSAPEKAKWHLYCADGTAWWSYMDREPKVDSEFLDSWHVGGSLHAAKTGPLPLGVDWRTTLRKRPEVGDE